MSLGTSRIHIGGKYPKVHECKQLPVDVCVSDGIYSFRPWCHKAWCPGQLEFEHSCIRPFVCLPPLVKQALTQEHDSKSSASTDTGNGTETVIMTTLTLSPSEPTMKNPSFPPFSMDIDISPFPPQPFNRTQLFRAGWLSSSQPFVKFCCRLQTKMIASLTEAATPQHSADHLPLPKVDWKTKSFKNARLSLFASSSVPHLRHVHVLCMGCANTLRNEHARKDVVLRRVNMHASAITWCLPCFLLCVTSSFSKLPTLAQIPDDEPTRRVRPNHLLRRFHCHTSV